MLVHFVSLQRHHRILLVMVVVGLLLPVVDPASVRHRLLDDVKRQAANCFGFGNEPWVPQIAKLLPSIDS